MVTRRENSDIIKFLTFHTTKSKKDWKEMQSIFERAITFNRLEKANI